MKKIFVALALAAFASSSFAIVENSKHDFNKSDTYRATAGNKAGRCMYCHTPHNAKTWVKVALWAISEPFTTSGSAVPGGNLLSFSNWSTATVLDPRKSATCLACHGDGAMSTTGLGADVTGAVMLGQELRNDHPIGSTATFSPGTSGWQSGPIYLGRSTFTNNGSYQVNCGTCHSVHNSGFLMPNSKLLYTTPSGATDFCTICHLH